MSMQTLSVARLERFQMSGPGMAVLDAGLGVTDLILSLAAFALGVPEGNPALAFMLQHGLFVPAKVLLTLFAGALIAALYRHDLVRRLAWFAVVAMAAVDIYHILSLHALLHRW